MLFTEDKHTPGHDHVVVRLDGEFVGFRGLDNTKICLEKCPKCKKQNYAMAVTSGVCCWCGLDINKLKAEAA